MKDAPAIKQPQKPNRLASAVSGSLAGMLVSACIQPLDVIRTRMQGDAAQGTVRATTATLKVIFQEGGVAGLWRGTSPTVARLGLGAGLHFFLLDTIKAALQQRSPDGSLSGMDAFISGGLSRALTTAMLCPITVVKTRMEYGGVGSAQRGYRGVAHALATIAHTERLGGLFRGLGPTILTNAPFSALFYTFYTQLQTRLKAEDRPSVLVNFASGTVAAIAATALTQPADVIRTRMQLTAGGSGRGALALAGNVFRKQGTRGLMMGMTPRVLKRTMQTALMWTLYEELMPRLTAVTDRGRKHSSKLDASFTASEPGDPRNASVSGRTST